MGARNTGFVVYLGREMLITTSAGIAHRCVPIEREPIGDETFRKHGDAFSGISEDTIYIGPGAEVADFDNEIAKLLPERPTVLFIRDNGAGDVLMSTAAVRAVRCRLPKARLVYATLPRHTELLEGNPDVDEIRSVHDLNLENSEFDLVVNWARAVEDYSIPRNRGHRIDSFARMIGMELEDRRTFLSLSDADRESARRFLEGRGTWFIGYVVQAAAWNRTWPVWRAPELLKELEMKLPEYKIVLIDTQKDAGIDAPNAVNACGATRTFKQAAALLERCELTVAQDTGLAHACGALGVPALALAGTLPPELRYGYYKNFSWIYPAGRVECCPCWGWQERWSGRERAENPARGIFKSCRGAAAPACLETITPEEIAERTREIIHEIH